MNKLVVIDGFAVLHRAFHALPPLTNSKGEMTNAVYGFATMMLRVVNNLKPTHIIVAFDRPKPTFRKQLYKLYQSKRPQMADELAGQIEKVRQLIFELGVTLLEKDGYEADDVIGTIVQKTVNSKQITEKNAEIVIVTGDRDLLQLVNSHVRVYMPVKGLSESKLYSEKEVQEKFHISSPQIVDYKALVGDASDNYPGVPGIGPTSAAKLLQQFSTLEGIYKHIDTIKNERLQNLLRTGRESAFMAKRLATIVTDVPIDIDFERCKLKSFDRPNVHKFFEEMGFWSLITRLTSKNPSPRGYEGLRTSNQQITDNSKEKTVNSKQTTDDISQKKSQQISLF